MGNVSFANRSLADASDSIQADAKLNSNPLLVVLKAHRDGQRVLAWNKVNACRIH